MKRKLINQNNIDINRFIKITEFGIVYFLGFLWADGHISKNSNQINFTVGGKDKLEILKCLKTSQLDFKLRENTHPQYPQKTLAYFRIVNKELKDFLIKNEYSNKSTTSPRKILKIIPKHLQNFFYLGWLDGDGCIFNKKSYHMVHFTGTIDQDWSCLTNLAQHLGLKFSINKLIRKNRKSSGSYFFISEYESCFKLLNYIYNSVDLTKIGFKRKYLIFLTMKDNCRHFLDTKKTGIDLVKNKFKIQIIHEGKRLSQKSFTTAEDAINFKKQLIKDYNTLEYRLRTLLNYWKFKTKFDNRIYEFQKDSLILSKNSLT